MPCGWEGNRKTSVALAMRHRLQWFVHTLHGAWHTLPYYRRTAAIPPQSSNIFHEKWKENGKKEEGESEWERQVSNGGRREKYRIAKAKKKRERKDKKSKTKKKETEWNGKGGKQESRVGKRKGMYYLWQTFVKLTVKR